MPGSRPPRALRLRLPSRRAVRLAALLWIVLGVVLWNALFDHAIVVAGRQYLFRQAQALRHNGPPVTIAEVMRPAAVRGAVVASLWSLLAVSAGLIAVRVAATRGGRAPRTADPPRGEPASTELPS